MVFQGLNLQQININSDTRPEGQCVRVCLCVCVCVRECTYVDALKYSLIALVVNMASIMENTISVAP